MIRHGLLLITAAALLCSLSGCSDAAVSAEDNLDAAIQKEHPGATVYLSSRDVDGVGSFVPDEEQPDLLIMSHCFNPDRVDMPSIKVMQDSVVIAEGSSGCEGGVGYVGMTPALFDPEGGEVTVEISPEDAKDMAFRLIGYTSSF